ncbi:unnamed protein product, partial [Iphiclides podalirius]
MDKSPPILDGQHRIDLRDSAKASPIGVRGDSAAGCVWQKAMIMTKTIGAKGAGSGHAGGRGRITKRPTTDLRTDRQPKNKL